MEHFDFAQWTDYVRGVSSPLDRELMTRHIAEGCESCSRLMALAGRIHQECGQEPVVPEYLVRAAKSVFPATHAAAAQPAWLSLPLLPAVLAFDSLAEPSQIGARNAPDYMVQTVHHVGDYAIEMQIERESESTEMTVVGQLVNRMSPGIVAADFPVLLMAGGKIVARATGNCYGEFCLVSRAQQGLRLCVHIAEAGKRVEVPLPSSVGRRQ